MPLIENMSLEEIRVWLEARVDAGVVCPACKVKSRRYTRHMSDRYVKALTMMESLGRTRGDENGWFKVGEKALGKDICADLYHLNHAKLAYWGLVEKMTKGHNHQTYSGYWRVTDLGRDFLAGQVKVCTFVKEYRGKAVGFSEEKIDVATANGVAFSFEEEVLGCDATL